MANNEPNHLRPVPDVEPHSSVGSSGQTADGTVGFDVGSKPIGFNPWVKAEMWRNRTTISIPSKFIKFNDSTNGWIYKYGKEISTVGLVKDYGLSAIYIDTQLSTKTIVTFVGLSQDIDRCIGYLKVPEDWIYEIVINGKHQLASYCTTCLSRDHTFDYCHNNCSYCRSSGHWVNCCPLADKASHFRSHQLRQSVTNGRYKDIPVADRPPVRPINTQVSEVPKGGPSRQTLRRRRAKEALLGPNGNKAYYKFHQCLHLNPVTNGKPIIFSIGVKRGLDDSNNPVAIQVLMKARVGHGLCDQVVYHSFVAAFNVCDLRSHFNGITPSILENSALSLPLPLVVRQIRQMLRHNVIVFWDKHFVMKCLGVNDDWFSRMGCHVIDAQPHYLYPNFPKVRLMAVYRVVGDWVRAMKGNPMNGNNEDKPYRIGGGMGEGHNIEMNARAIYYLNEWQTKYGNTEEFVALKKGLSDALILLEQTEGIRYRVSH